MSFDQDLRRTVRGHGEKLAILGMELGKIQFSYKVEERPTVRYWQERIDNFKRYNEKGIEYYNMACAMINLADKEESQMFLLHISKFRQLGLALVETMEMIKENPSIIDPKDRQQSQWSREIREQVTENGNRCLRHEKEINASFREFYETRLKKFCDDCS